MPATPPAPAARPAAADAVPPDPPGRSPTSSPARRPGLDGLRGLALAGMLAWHAEVPWVQGGFARMTVFFALSGFLATRSYLRLTARPGGQGRWPVAMRAFAVRRARRLLPITVVGLAAAAAVTLAVGTTDMRGALRGDVVSVVAAMSNWRFLTAERAYGALFERPSAVQHLWSLSLEEQSLLVLPLVLLLVLGAARGGRVRAAALATVLAAALAAIPAVVAHTPDAAYYGTHVRAGEFVAGVALALLLDRWGGAVPIPARRAVQVVGSGSLALLAFVMLTVERDLDWLYRGGLGLFALPAVAVIAAAGEARGPVPWLLGQPALVRLGRAAFSIYMLHWPLFVLVRHTVGPDAGLVWMAAELAAGVAIGLVAHHHIEAPLMAPAPAQRWRSDRRIIGAAVAGLVLVAAIAGVVPAPEPAYDFAGAERRAGGEGVVAAPGDGRPAVALFGGSTAVSLGAVAHDWSATRAAPVRVAPGMTQLGCGVVTEGLRRVGPSIVQPPDEYCAGWERRWPAAADMSQVRVAVIFGGVWETADWRLDGTSEWTDLTDTPFAELVHAKLTTATALLSEGDRRVLIATTPAVGPGASGRARAERGLRADHARRVEIYNSLVRSVAASNDRVDVLEYGALIDGLDAETSAAWLPDGIHPTDAASLTVWDQLIGPAVVAAVTPEPTELLTAPPPEGPGT